MPLLILAICVFGIFLSTLCPTVYLGDSGELAAAAFSLGIPHNSGYPLYCLLGKLFCLIPMGNIGFRVNLMSAFFAVLTVWLVFSLIFRITSSKAGAFAGSLLLAFTPVLWSQTVSSEVYTLHAFFVALLIRLLWWWEEGRLLFRLVLFVFITGISFGNHLQTVMLAPAVLFLILSADKKYLLNVRPFFLFSVFFILALSLYVYLPVRTVAGAAMHWGDPDSLDRFMAHVTGRSHRGGYVLNKTLPEYLHRTGETLLFVWSQLGVILLMSLWGWLTLRSVRWRIFFVLIILFDFVYTIFLNIISLKITPFALPSCIVLAILSGVGLAHALRAAERISGIGHTIQKTMKAACCLIPVIPFLLNYGLSDQSRNYTAYEHALNIFRTTDYGDILFMGGDNYVFPVTYGRIAEKMREDIILYDRLNIIFKMPNVVRRAHPLSNTWENKRNRMEKGIIETRGSKDVYYAVYGPYSIHLPDRRRLITYGILHRVVKEGTPINPHDLRNLWRFYSTISFYDHFQRDFMNREISAYFYFCRGKDLILRGQSSPGLKNMALASRIGYDDTLIHSDMGIFLTDNGFFKEARRELEKALIYHEDLSGVHNNWGYYYHKIKDYDAAITSFRKAVELKPRRFSIYNNLGFALYEAGKYDESFNEFKNSLAIEKKQPEIQRFIEKYLNMKGGGSKPPGKTTSFEKGKE